jgi:hypothetical protein
MLMQGFPPPQNARVTLANWQDPHSHARLARGMSPQFFRGEVLKHDTPSLVIEK